MGVVPGVLSNCCIFPAIPLFCQASSNPVNTIFDVKRLIGRKSADATVKADVQLFPFTGKTRSVVRVTLLIARALHCCNYCSLFIVIATTLSR